MTTQGNIQITNLNHAEAGRLGARKSTAVRRAREAKLDALRAQLEPLATSADGMADVESALALFAMILRGQNKLVRGRGRKPPDGKALAACVFNFQTTLARLGVVPKHADVRTTAPPSLPDSHSLSDAGMPDTPKQPERLTVAEWEALTDEGRALLRARMPEPPRFHDNEWNELGPERQAELLRIWK